MDNDIDKEEVRDFARRLLPVTYRELRMFSRFSDPLSKKTVAEVHERIIKLQRMMNTGIPELLFTPN